MTVLVPFPGGEDNIRRSASASRFLSSASAPIAKYRSSLTVKRPNASRAGSLQRQNGLLVTVPTGIPRSLMACLIRLACSRPTALRLRCVSQLARFASSSLAPAWSVVACRKETTKPPLRRRSPLPCHSPTSGQHGSSLPSGPVVPCPTSILELAELQLRRPLRWGMAGRATSLPDRPREELARPCERLRQVLTEINRRSGDRPPRRAHGPGAPTGRGRATLGFRDTHARSRATVHADDLGRPSQQLPADEADRHRVGAS